MDSCIIETPLGFAKIIGNSDGVQSITITEKGAEASTDIPVHLRACIKELKAYFMGELENFTFKINPQGTEFQKRVWAGLLQVPFGKTWSYLKLSKVLGDPKAIRAVASANGKNPLWIVVPCHRVIGSDGSLTGYAGGLPRKKWLLEHEGALAQLSLF